MGERSYPGSESAELARRIESHVKHLANTNMNLPLGAWGQIANDLLDAARALRTGGVAQGWQDIGTAPKDGTGILVTDARVIDWTQVAYWDDEATNDWVWARDDASTRWHKDMFTHWMPLPAGPSLTSTQEHTAAAVLEDPRSAPAGDNKGSERGPRYDLLMWAATVAEKGAKQCVDGDSEWHRGFRYAASNTALGIAADLRRAALALSSTASNTPEGK